MLEVMSTRSIIVFKNKYCKSYIYVHFDGYPSNRLVQLQEFLVWNKPRNGDVGYSAANFVLWYKIDKIQEFNEYYDGDKSKHFNTLEDILRPSEKDDHRHRGIGIVDETADDYRYKYVVDFDAKTIRVTKDGFDPPKDSIDVTVAFGQVVEFDENDNIIEEEPQMPAN